MSDYFELVGVANSNLRSAELAAVAPGAPRAFESAAALAAAPDIDVVIVAVKVPHHRETVTTALQNRKAVIKAFTPPQLVAPWTSDSLSDTGVR